jgi:hypothetical protein
MGGLMYIEITGRGKIETNVEIEAKREEYTLGGK